MNYLLLFGVLVVTVGVLTGTLMVTTRIFGNSFSRGGRYRTIPLKMIVAGFFRDFSTHSASTTTTEACIKMMVCTEGRMVLMLESSMKQTA